MRIKTLIFFFAFFTPLSGLLAQRQMEYLDRGTVALRYAADSVFISWRLLGTENQNLLFNLYRQSEGKVQKLNAQPLSAGTHFIDTDIQSSVDYTYTVKALKNGKEESSKPFLLKAHTPVQQYLNIPLKTPEGYRPGDASVGDLDGDGAYEIILHQTGKGADNSFTGITDPPIFQAYKIDGTLLWQINLGKNIREGAHYTQFMVYDLDGDGIAEFACKTADGTVDGKGKIIGDPRANWQDTVKASRTFGKIMRGPEYFTIFSGKTGEALATVDYIPSRGNTADWGGHGGNGRNDNTGNRVDRFLACIAYLDGGHPSVVMCRGYYGRTVLAAWDWHQGKLTSRWVFDTEEGENPFSGQGNHNLTVADVDGDGRDEIIYGSMCVDDNGKGLYTTGFRHGDAIHVGDLDSERPGLEVFGIHEIEEETKGPGMVLYAAENGKVLVRMEEDQDVGRGVAENIDPEHKGAYMWWGRTLYDIHGNKVGTAPRSANFLVWWDDDLSRELLNSNTVEKYKKGKIFTAEGAMPAQGAKATPVISADLFGDWREEIVLRSADNQSLRIYSTVIPTVHRIPTLMHDPQYRLSIAWQNVGYNMPPHTGYYLGTGMKQVPKPNIKTIRMHKID